MSAASSEGLCAGRPSRAAGRLPQGIAPQTAASPRLGEGATYLNPVTRRLSSSPIGQNWVMCPAQRWWLAKGREPGCRQTPQLSTQHPIPEHGGGSAGRKMVGGSVQLETHQAARLCWKFWFFFLASALFLTRNIILSKPVSHRALLTEAWWIISTSVQIPRETQMPGKG